MTLSHPRAIGFAVRAGMPIDAADWVTVELDPFLEQRSRGVIVATEPVETDGHSFEVARLARELILSELNAMRDLPPDEAVGRAFAVANGMLYDEAQTSPNRGYDRKVLIGATAVLLEGHRCVIGHVPPGQLVLIEDRLAYAIPDLETWAPDFRLPNDMPSPPEPLGYTSWTAPILAETELSDGDEILLCSASLAESLALDLLDSEVQVQELAGYHGRSPDQALEIFKGLLVSERIEDGSALVLAFPPQPGSFGVVSMEDVRWKLRDRRRRARAQVRALLPNRKRSREIAPAPVLDFSDGSTFSEVSAEVQGAPPEEIDQSDNLVVEERSDEVSRWRRFVPNSVSRRSAETWAQPDETRQYGVPRTHGVQMHRTVTIDRKESRWRGLLPRIPLAGPLLAALLLGVVVLLIFGLLSTRDDNPPEAAYTTLLNQADQYILTADETASPEGRRQALDLASSALDEAREAGAPDQAVALRMSAITESLDELDNVLRVDNLTRVGTLPDELQGGGTSAQLTGSGLFLVNGGLYQIRTDQRQIVPILEEGETAGDIDVGSLFGVAVDALGLHVTDGRYVYTLRSDGSWVPVQLGRINNLPWEPSPMGAFGGSVYLLTPEYRNIYQFDTEDADGVAEPRDWVLSSVRPDLVRAVDMAIDRNIQVLLDNQNSVDEVFLYTQGDLAERYTVPYLGIEDTRPVSLLIGSGTGFYYVAVEEAESGVVVVFDPSSDAAWQIRLPPDFTAADAEVAEPFQGLQDIAIDEQTGTIYLVNEDAVWTAQYQLPVSMDGTPTPEPADGE